MMLGVMTYKEMQAYLDDANGKLSAAKVMELGGSYYGHFECGHRNESNLEPPVLQFAIDVGKNLMDTGVILTTYTVGVRYNPKEGETRSLKDKDLDTIEDVVEYLKSLMAAAGNVTRAVSGDETTRRKRIGELMAEYNIPLFTVAGVAMTAMGTMLLDTLNVMAQEPA